MENGINSKLFENAVWNTVTPEIWNYYCFVMNLVGQCKIKK